MEHDEHDDPDDPYDEWLMATMAWEGGLPQPVAELPDIDEHEQRPDG